MVLPPDAYKWFNVHNVAHLTTTFNGAPYARLSDGAMRLVCSATMKPSDILATLLDQPSGHVVQNPQVLDVACTAIVIEPTHPTRAEVFEEHYRDAAGVR
ncbi:hypothetical protein H9P43_009081 [Blastocladiella emersonii ATCC 22665]|nr:hypothetical protein H9P43_009081 [Blastocladiella emersonii ATCC 22665]